MSARSLAVALSLLDRRARIACGVMAVGLAVERLLVLAAAVMLASGDRRIIGASVGMLAVLYLGRSILRGKVRVSAQANIHRRAAVALLRSDPLTRVVPDGDPDLVLNDGVHYGSTLLADRAPSFAGEVVASACILVFVIATVAPRFLVVGGCGLLLAGCAALFARRLTRRAEDLSWEVYRPLLERMLLVMRGRMELVANGVAPSYLTALERILVAFERGTLRSNRMASVAARLPLLAGAAGIGLAAVAQGSGTVLHPAALADLAVLGSVLPAFIGLVQNGHETWLLTLRFRPMASILTAPMTPRSGAAPFPREASTIAFSEVRFRYAGSSRDAVHGISLTFARGEPLVLSGPNGSGKSTILRLLAGLGDPSQGSITIGRADTRTLDLSSWRSHVAYLPQQPHLAEAMTVGETMTLFAPDATPAEMLRALDAVELREALVARAPSGPLAARIGDLSIGQRKRVALARVLLEDAGIVLLDEPDANLDAEGVAMVGRLIRELASTRLVAVAAHSDRIASSFGVHVRLAA